MRNSPIFSAVFNYFYAVLCFASGRVAFEGADVAISPCHISPYLNFGLQALLTFFFPLVLVVVRWYMKDKQNKTAANSQIKE